MSRAGGAGAGGPVLSIERDGDAVTVTVVPKINLFLEVVRRRPDGFHELDTLFAAAFPDDDTNAWIDRVRVKPSARDRDAIRFRGRGEDALEDLPGVRTTVGRIAAALRERGVDVPPVEIEVKKGIPLEAGLGGGSADAAAGLIAIERVFGLALDSSFRFEVAREVGSDVPFFLAGEAIAIGLGRGDRIEPVREAPLGSTTPTVVLVKPPFGVSTPAVFQRVSFPLTDPSGPLGLPRAMFSTPQTDSEAGWLGGVFNRLESFAGQVEPRLDAIRREIERAVRAVEAGALEAGALEAGALEAGALEAGAVAIGAGVAPASESTTIWMSGSGSTFVVAGLEPAAARELARVLAGPQRHGTVHPGDARRGENENVDAQPLLATTARLGAPISGG